MKGIIEWIKNKFLCIKYGKKDCRECEHYYDDGDWWGCNLGLKNYRKQYFDRQDFPPV